MTPSRETMLMNEKDTYVDGTSDLGQFILIMGETTEQSNDVYVNVMLSLD